MGAKGSATKKHICEEAYKLFADNGYKNVTMKDICEKTGLSRGGLYRHYESTEQIFLEIVSQFTNNQKNLFDQKMKQGIPADVILEEMFAIYAREMTDSKNSLSLAIYEFYSNPEISKTDNAIKRQYENSKSMWIDFINYGIKNGDFKKADPEAVFDIIVFSYQGVRMYSKLMEIDNDIPDRIIAVIKKLLISEEN